MGNLLGEREKIGQIKTHDREIGTNEVISEDRFALVRVLVQNGNMGLLNYHTILQ